MAMELARALVCSSVPEREGTLATESAGELAWEKAMVSVLWSAKESVHGSEPAMERDLDQKLVRVLAYSLESKTESETAMALGAG